MTVRTHVALAQRVKDAANLKAEIAGGTGAFAAWGSGDGAWGSTPPAIDDTVTALTARLGMFPCTVEYGVADAEGEVELFSGEKFNISEDPTDTLLFLAGYDFADEVAATIRELCVYINPTVSGGHIGDAYIPTGYISAVGRAAFFQRFPGVPRSAITNGDINLAHSWSNPA